MATHAGVLCDIVLERALPGRSLLFWNYPTQNHAAAFTNSVGQARGQETSFIQCQRLSQLLYCETSEWGRPMLTILLDDREVNFRYQRATMPLNALYLELQKLHEPLVGLNHSLLVLWLDKLLFQDSKPLVQ